MPARRIFSRISHDIWAAIGADFGVMSAYSFMVFNLLCAPVSPPMGAIRREMNNARWTMGAIGYMCLFAYVTSMIVFQLGGLITGEASFGLGTVVAAVLWPVSFTCSFAGVIRARISFG